MYDKEAFGFMAEEYAGRPVWGFHFTGYAPRCYITRNEGDVRFPENIRGLKSIYGGGPSNESISRIREFITTYSTTGDVSHLV